MLALATLACEGAPPRAAMVEPTRTPWPTFTPTAAPLAVTEAAPFETPGAAPTSATPSADSPAPAASLAAQVASPVSPVTSPVSSTLSLTFTPALTAATLTGAPPLVTDTPPAGTPPSTPEGPGGTPPAAITPSPTPTQTVAPTPTSAPAATPIPSTNGWSFAKVQVYPDQYAAGLLLYGELVNGTGASQEVLLVTGTFYDAQGQTIADESSAYGYSPVPIIPPGGRAPFELIVDGIQEAADFDLRVDAQTSDMLPRQDFEFSDVSQYEDEFGYCIMGSLRNPGSPLQDFIVTLVVLYDAQDRVISFGEYYPSLEDLVGDQAEQFEVCADSYGQSVARYELQAWGQ